MADNEDKSVSTNIDIDNENKFEFVYYKVVSF